MLSRQTFFSNKGSVTIESALILPLIIGVFVVGYTFLYASFCHAKIQNKLNELCIELNYRSYILHEIGIIDKLQSLYEMNKYQQLTFEEATRFLDNVKTQLISSHQITDITPDEAKVSYDRFNTDNDLQYFLEDIYNITGEIENIVNTSAKFSSTIKEEAIYYVFRQYVSYFVQSPLQNFCDDENMDTVISLETCNVFLEGDAGKITMSYSLKIPFLFGLSKQLQLSNSGYVHLFTGANTLIQYSNVDLESGDYGHEDTTGSTDTVSEDDNGLSKEVYVTNNGIRYHEDKYCFHINVIAQPLIWTPSLKKTGCEICVHEDSLNEYMIVYATEGSSVFHTNYRCRTIYHSVRTISEKEAIVKGYTPCKTCSK